MQNKEEGGGGPKRPRREHRRLRRCGLSVLYSKGYFSRPNAMLPIG